MSLAFHSSFVYYEHSALSSLASYREASGSRAQPPRRNGVASGLRKMLGCQAIDVEVKLRHGTKLKISIILDIRFYSKPLDVIDIFSYNR